MTRSEPLSTKPPHSPPIPEKHLTSRLQAEQLSAVQTPVTSVDVVRGIFYQPHLNSRLQPHCAELTTVEQNNTDTQTVYKRPPRNNKHTRGCGGAVTMQEPQQALKTSVGIGWCWSTHSLPVRHCSGHRPPRSSL